ncbi:MAG: AhpC/TSA family protein [Acidobacteriales bacterium]|nr:AhpC/TSA family protein [Terriglobales bacterium]
MSLQAQLEGITHRVRSLVPPEKLDATERAIAELADSGLAQSAIGIGAQAPAFELPDAYGGLVRQKDLLALEKLIIIFFRGRWCPYCVAQLEAMQQALPEIRARRANLLAISPQTARQTSFMVEQHRLSFPVLCDSGNRVARQFGLVYRLPKYLEEQYRRTMINLPNCNGDQSWELPLTATYVCSGRATSCLPKSKPIIGCDRSLSGS